MASGDPTESLLKSKHLYLFEVLVKSVDIKEKLLEESERENIFKNPLKLRIIFSDFYDVEINEVKDIKSIHLPQPEQVKCHSKMTKMFSNNETISKGKDDKLNSTKDDNEQIDFIKKSSEHSRRAGFSCLFPMNPVHLIQKLKTSYLYLMVYGNCGIDNDTKLEVQKIIGQAKVSIRSNFIDSVHYALSIDEFPTTASLATTCNVRNSFQEKTGKIEIYVRLSCFGKYIISMFNMMKNNPQAANASQPIEKKEEKKPIKQKKLMKTVSSQSTKNQTAQPSASSQSIINLTASLQRTKSRNASAQPTMNQTASPRPTKLQPESSLSAVTLATPPEATASQNASAQPTVNQTAPSLRPTKLQSVSSRSTVNLATPPQAATYKTVSAQPTMNPTAPTLRPTKLQSVPSRSAVNLASPTQAATYKTASAQPTMNQTAPSKPQTASSRSSKAQTTSSRSSKPLTTASRSSKPLARSSKYQRPPSTKSPLASPQQSPNKIRSTNPSQTKVSS